MIISFRIAAAALARPEHHLLDSALRFAAERGVVRKELDDGMLAVETTFAAWAELGSLADTLADPDEHADAEELVDALELQMGEDAPAPAIAIKLSGIAAQPKSELQVFVGGGRVSFTSGSDGWPSLNDGRERLRCGPMLAAVLDMAAEYNRADTKGTRRTAFLAAKRCAANFARAAGGRRSGAPRIHLPHCVPAANPRRARPSPKRV